MKCSIIGSLIKILRTREYDAVKTPDQIVDIFKLILGSSLNNL